MCVCPLSRVWLFAAPWTVAFQAPLSMGFSRQEYWSRLLFPTPGWGGFFLNQRWKNLLCLLHWQSDFSPPAPPGKPLEYISLFNPENNQKSASICTNEKKKWNLKTLSNLSKDTPSKWSSQDFNAGGRTSKACTLPSTGWVVGTQRATWRVSSHRLQTVPPNNLERGLRGEQSFSVWSLMPYQHHREAYQECNLFFLNCWKGTAIWILIQSPGENLCI